MFEDISNINAYLKNESAAQKMAQKLAEGQEKLSANMTSHKKKNDYRLSSIKRKLRQGRRLSSTDMAYLRKNAPSLHQKAARIERIRKELEQKIKNCKSKEEFNRLRTFVTQSAVDIGSVCCIAPNSDTSQNLNTGANINAGQGTDISSSDTDMKSDSSQNSNDYEPDDSGVYLYRSLDFTYRAFKQGITYNKLPLNSHKRPDKHKMNFKV